MENSHISGWMSITNYPSTCVPQHYFPFEHIHLQHFTQIEPTWSWISVNFPFQMCIAVSFLVILVHLTSSASVGNTRPPVSDEVIDKALQDKRYLMRQLKCAIGEAPCDPVGRRLKSKFLINLYITCTHPHWILVHRFGTIRAPGKLPSG